MFIPEESMPTKMIVCPECGRTLEIKKPGVVPSHQGDDSMTCRGSGSNEGMSSAEAAEAVNTDD
jgi:hypothetical protein